MRLDNKAVDEAALGEALRPRGPVALTIEEHREDGQVVLELGGELDILTAPRLGSRVHELARRHDADLVIDLRELRFIDSSGLHILLNAQRVLIRRERRLRVRCVRAPVLRVIELARLTETLGVVG